MRAVDEVDERAEPAAAAPAPAPARRRNLRDLVVYAGYLALSLLVMCRLWIDPNGRVLSSNDDDHGVFLFMLAHAERVVFHGESPFYSERLNVPDGVNMMANTSILALSLPVAPITHFLGGGVSVAVLLTLGLAGTAAAWYFVFSRHLLRTRRAAWIGGLWCGFCPAMVSHANGHINFVAQFVVPFIVWQVLRLREPGRAVRGGIVLALLVVLQVFINEETLLFTALTLGVFVLAYAAMARADARAVAPRFLAGLGVTAVTASALLAYPLWWQFFGPRSYHGQPFDPGHYVTDLLSVGAYARQSLAGNGAIARQLSVSGTEDNTFFGVPLLIMLGVCLAVLWRSAAARATAVAGLVLLIASMGPWLRVAGQDTSIPLPFGLISHVPIIDLVSVTRFAIVTATVVGVLLALAADRIPQAPHRRRVAFWIGLTVALVPVAPKPLPIVEADPIPSFIADGTWRSYVPEDRTLVPVPLPDVTTGRTAMRWATLANLEFRVPRGYFMGPANPPADDTGSWSAPPRATSNLLWRVREYGRPVALTEADRAAAVADLTFWRAAVVVLVPDSRNGELLEDTVTGLLRRQPLQVGGVLVWDVRDLPVPSAE
ncbi:hypothetical protein [Jidongwangia harbinensis]|uniref:hypothetical protein n=1 Tax=Jidongwangia harbinensis TaxID=2878561 RepID=UPI001CDA0CF6|nr:hypothetical protein [Jidongwangia harbinensis]MCA2212285.1 hypothetical protein [Jidongwangia harbinensis]